MKKAETYKYGYYQEIISDIFNNKKKHILIIFNFLFNKKTDKHPYTQCFIDQSSVRSVLDS